MARPSRRLLANAVAARLAGLTPATIGYYGAIGRALTSPVPSGWVAEPPAKSQQDGRVQPYFVLYPGAGTDGPDPNLADTSTDLTAPFAITAAAGDVEDLMALVDRIDARLNRWAPAIPDLVCGPLRPLPGFNPGLLVDKAYTPNRPYLPLQYVLTATT